MAVYMICIAVWGGLAFFWVKVCFPQRKYFQALAAAGVAVCTSLMIFGFQWDWIGFWGESSVIGSILFRLGLILMIPSGILIMTGAITLKKKGHPSGPADDTSHLVTTGIFRWIRHPMYLGFSLWGAGLAFLFQNLVSLIAGCLALGCFFTAARLEETYNIKKFGRSYIIFKERGFSRTPEI